MKKYGARAGFVNALLLLILAAYVVPTHYSLHSFRLHSFGLHNLGLHSFGLHNLGLNNVALHKNVHLNYGEQNATQWLQPATLGTTYPVLVSNNNWRIDYANIEKRLWKSKTNADGGLLVNSDTLALLENANKELPNDINTAELERLSFLVSQSLPDTRGRSLAVLLEKYHFYDQDYQANLIAINQAVIEQKLLLLQKNELNNKQRQERYFGSGIAAKLFGEKNNTTHYLNKRRIISMRKDLTKKQQAEQLQELKENYKASLRSVTR